MIYAIYIAAAAVVGVLNGLVILSIAWLRKSVSNNIRSKTTELISVYDELLEEKSSELAALTRQADGGAPSGTARTGGTACGRHACFGAAEHSGASRRSRVPG